MAFPVKIVAASTLVGVLLAGISGPSAEASSPSPAPSHSSTMSTILPPLSPIFPATLDDPEIPREVAKWFQKDGREMASRLAERLPEDQRDTVKVGAVFRVRTWSGSYLRGVANSSDLEVVPGWVAPITSSAGAVGVLVFRQENQRLTPKGVSIPGTIPIPADDKVKKPVAEGNYRVALSEPENSRNAVISEGNGAAYLFPRLAALLLEASREGSPKTFPVYDARLGTWFVIKDDRLIPVTRDADVMLAGPAPISDLGSFVRSWWGLENTAPAHPEEAQPTPLGDVLIMVVLTLIAVAALMFFVILPGSRNRQPDYRSPFETDPELIPVQMDTPITLVPTPRH